VGFGSSCESSGQGDLKHSWDAAQILCELPGLQTAAGAGVWGALLQATLKALEQRSEQEPAQEAPPESFEDLAEESQG
jgi:hypothetical protein